jgi:lipopolysaccharide transport system ATP-binding protein
VSMSENDLLVRVENVSKRFCRNLRRSLWYGIQDIAGEFNPLARNGDSSELPLRKHEFWAVEGVSLELRRGECLGLIGKNGAGKTTLLKMLNGLIKPDSGRIEMHGRVGALIALGAGFNPVLTGRENIYVNGSILGLSKKEITRKLDEIVEFAEVSAFIDTPVQSYSSGMQVRLGFAIAAKLIKPDILFLDEVLAVGDLPFRVKCLNAVAELTQEAAVVFVSHSMPQVARICSNAMLLEHGTIRYSGNDVTHAIDLYLQEFKGGIAREVSNGQARLVSAEIVDEQGNRRTDTQVGYGARLTIRTEIAIEADISPVRITATLWNQEMRPVAELVKKDGTNLIIDTTKGDLLTCTLSVPAVHLSPGIYSLTIIIGHPTTQNIVLRTDNVLSFQVKTHKPCWADILLPCDVLVTPVRQDYDRRTYERVFVSATCQPVDSSD